MLQDLNTVISSGITAVISLFAFISLGFLVIGGYKYLAAGSDKAQTEQARNTIIYSLAGLIVTLSAFVILKLIGSFLGINVGTFDICIVRGVGCS